MTRVRPVPPDLIDGPVGGEEPVRAGDPANQPIPEPSVTRVRPLPDLSETATDPPPAAPPALTRVRPVPDLAPDPAPAPAAPAPSPQPKGFAGLLRRLFGRRSRKS